MQTSDAKPVSDSVRRDAEGQQLPMLNDAVLTVRKRRNLGIQTTTYTSPVTITAVV